MPLIKLQLICSASSEDPVSGLRERKGWGYVTHSGCRRTREVSLEKSLSL